VPGVVGSQSNVERAKAPASSTTDRSEGSSGGADGRFDRGRVAPDQSGRHPAALEPRAAIRFVGWLRRPRSRHRLLRSAWGRTAGLIVLTVVLGTWGFKILDVSPKLTWEQSFYHSIKLFAIDLGPAGGGAKTASGSPVVLDWPIRIAMIGAVFVILRALLAVGRDHLRRRFMRHWLSGHVIVCGGGVHGARLVRELADKHDVVLVDVDGGAAGLQETRGDHEWRLVGDATAAETLFWAGIERAHWIVAVSGDDYANSQIASVVRTLPSKHRPRDGLQVLVQIEDPLLEHFFEESEAQTDEEGEAQTNEDGEAQTEDEGSAHPVPAGPFPMVTVFGGNAIAASALFGEGPKPEGKSSHDDALLLAVEDQSLEARRLLLLVGDHPLLEAIVLAALRRLRGEKLRALEEKQGYVPTLRIALIGPGAAARVTELKERWRPESSLLELEGKDFELGGGDTLEDDRWLLDRRLPGHAVVACEEELDGIGLTLTMSRALGNGAPLTRVTAQPESDLDRHLHAHTKHSPYLATTNVRSISDLAWKSRGIRRILVRERLACALREQGDDDAEGRADRLLDARLVELRSDAAPRLSMHDRELTSAVLKAAAREAGSDDPVPVSALVRAGLVVDTESLQNLWLAATGFSSDENAHKAFMAWCDYAQHVPAEPLTLASEALTRSTNGDIVASGILELRDTAITRLTGVFTDPHVEDDEQPNLLRGASRVVKFVGTQFAEVEELDQESARLLTRSLLGFDGVILTDDGNEGLEQAVGTQPRISFHHQSGERELTPASLALWADVMSSGFAPSDVRVATFSRDERAKEEVALARALGAMVVSVGPRLSGSDQVDDPPLRDDDVLELPWDPMTLRAFLVRPLRTSLDARTRHHVAKFIHEDYRRKQRNNKPADDAAMAPWEQLPPVLQQSNLAQADDIPSKLALIGMRVVEKGEEQRGEKQTGEALKLDEAKVELLAEVEHGRYNFERLSTGWTLGPRYIEHQVNPSLKPWSQLTDELKQWDRDAVLNIGPALNAAGARVMPIETA
jgi:hypothetical protein